MQRDSDNNSQHLMSYLLCVCVSVCVFFYVSLCVYFIQPSQQQETSTIILPFHNKKME